MISLSPGTADSARPLLKEIDEDFVSRHLTSCPKAVLTRMKKLPEIENPLRNIWNICAGKEQLMCKPLIAVLNRISQEATQFQVLYASPLAINAAAPTLVTTSRCSATTSASRTIKTAGQDYTGAAILFLGYPWASRTTIFSVYYGSSEVTTLKDSFLPPGRGTNEAGLLLHIHAESDVPGVVRRAEDVECNGDVIQFIDGGTGETRLKRRLALADTGAGLEYAQTVNDLLKAAYDKNASWVGSFPPLIDDILVGKFRAPDCREPRSLSIDYDHAAQLLNDNQNKTAHKELTNRTGTPMYIARADLASDVYCSDEESLEYCKMPPLSEKSKALYIDLHGEDRYTKYNDDVDSATFHGRIPRPGDLYEVQDMAVELPFSHRWEHHADAVFWSITWTTLKQHRIPANASIADSPDFLFTQYLDAFVAPFPPVMRDVAILLYHLSHQVGPSYALMSPPPPLDDHLHEAMQRLILDYLVEHEHDPIPLTPGALRPSLNEHEDPH
ncbi:hypothetical protein BD413DRAFT_678229 [Trametes elegans]|nr:hypothetical protein BD413DRAFT_678229 [Trametes elegans]